MSSKGVTKPRLKINERRKMTVDATTSSDASNMRLRSNSTSNPQPCTIGVQFTSSSINVNGKIIKAQFWDTAGQERYRAVVSAYYRGAVGALIVYDITRKMTFEHVGRWLKELRDHSDQNMVIMLLGNKAYRINLGMVQREDAKTFAERENIKLFMEISALDKSSVDNAFTKLVTQIYKHVVKKELDMANHHIVEPKGQMISVGHEDVRITKGSVGFLLPKHTSN
ncbi:unnamed protein product [Lactuca virosa]|uniref:Uncharacterized protein n=1 Tax=Lactuca virosa TaxID=75947 RepID=A0AAU9M4P9_9ASTR|nr:unnamed protein product [Lactuca virosa]